VTRVTAGEVPPIDREGAVREIEVPGGRAVGEGAFEGAFASARGREPARPGSEPGGIYALTGEEGEGRRVQVIPLSEATKRPGAAEGEEEEGELPKPFKELERSEPRHSRATAEFRERVRERVEELAREPPEGEEPEEVPAIEVKDRHIMLNFENLEIRDLILQLQKEGILPLNYILDASVQGSITIKTADPIAPEDLLDVILTILQANGLTIVKDGDFFRIIAAPDAKSFNIETYVTHSSRAVEDVNEVVTIIVPLEYISTSQAVSILGQFADKDANIIEYQAGNLLFMTGFSARLKRLLQILELVDIGTSREELRVYQIYHTSAEDLKTTIEQIMSSDFAARFAEAQARGRRRRTAPQPTGGDGARQPIIIADARSNRLIAFASKRELEFIERIIELLDQEIVVSDKIYIYQVENAEAGQLAETLVSIYGEQVSASTTGGTGQGAAGAARPGAAGAVPGATQEQQGLRNRGGRQSTQQQRGQSRTRQSTQRGQTRQVRPGQPEYPEGSDASDPEKLPDMNLAYAGAEEEAEAEPDGQIAQATIEDQSGRSPTTSRPPRIVERTGAGRRAPLERDEYYEDLLLKEGTGLVSGQINIVADERTNSLIVKTSPANWPIIKETIRKLDVQPKQVLIDVLIAEVTLDETNEFGIEWSVLSENSVGDYTFQGTTQTNFGVSGQNTGFTYTLLEPTRFRGFLRAFANENELEVLSRPHLLASNNTEASFEVGNQIPVVTQQFSGTAPPGQTPTTGLFNSIEYRDTGIIISITPRINATNFVTLDADIEISEAQSNTIGGTDQPIIRQRKVATSVVVQKSRTLLIGGIMEQKRDISKQNIPWIRRVPLLKHLFGTQKRNVRKTELFIAITPHVVANPEDAAQQSTHFREALGTQIDKMLEEGGQPRKWWEP
jgi:general secretion pathway protein D